MPAAKTAYVGIVHLDQPAQLRPLRRADAASIILGLQDEIRRSQESRYDQRLHGVLLVAQGMTCPQLARLLGDTPRPVA